MTLLIRRAPEPSCYAEELQSCPYGNWNTFAGNRMSLKIQNIENLSERFDIPFTSGKALSLDGVHSLSLTGPVHDFWHFPSLFSLLPNLSNVNLSNFYTSANGTCNFFLSELFQNCPKVNRISWIDSHQACTHITLSGTCFRNGKNLTELCLDDCCFYSIYNEREITERLFENNQSISLLNEAVPFQESGTSQHQKCNVSVRWTL